MPILNNDQLTQLKAKLQGPAQKVAVVPHLRPDGDAIGSCMAVKLWLQQLGHQVVVISPSEVSVLYHFLPGAEKILNAEVQPAQAEQELKSAELLIALDFSRTDRVGNLQAALESFSGYTLNIDHHKDSDAFADVFYWDASASSTCELVYRLMEELQMTDAITSPLADALYLGLVTDTGSFRFPSVSARVHRIVADLIERGCNFAAVHHFLGSSFSAERMQYLGYALSTGLQVWEDHHFAWIEIPLSIKEQYGYHAGYNEGIVNYTLAIRGVNLGVLLSEDTDRVKLSFRSVGEFPANELAKAFGGGGHHNAAGGISALSLPETRKKLVSLVKDYRDQLNYNPYPDYAAE